MRDYRMFDLEEDLDDEEFDSFPICKKEESQSSQKE